jgi:HEPN domain-containing protein
MLPKNNKALEKEYSRCQKSFIAVDRGLYTDYFEEAYSDLDSADREKSDKWAITKAYQALFLYCNGLLVRSLGVYSKDHGCVLVGLLKNSIVSEEILKKIHDMLEDKKKVFTEIELENNFFEETGRIRIARNKYLYLPKTQRKLRESPKERIKEIKEIIKILSEIE